MLDLTPSSQPQRVTYLIKERSQILTNRHILIVKFDLSTCQDLTPSSEIVGEARSTTRKEGGRSLRGSFSIIEAKGKKHI